MHSRAKDIQFQVNDSSSSNELAWRSYQNAADVNGIKQRGSPKAAVSVRDTSQVLSRNAIAARAAVCQGAEAARGGDGLPFDLFVQRAASA